MATTIKQTEAAPSDYPDRPTGLSTAAAALDPDVVWQRIESYIAYRWTERDVVWVVEGPGEWTPPLTPAAITSVEIWSCGAEEWEAADLSASSLGGFYVPATGPYRFTGIVGHSSPALDPPAALLAAFKRLAEYLAAPAGKPGATSEHVTAGSVSVTTSRSASWMASALQNSGAADLLRPYRKT